jgi:hypothetical protein
MSPEEKVLKKIVDVLSADTVITAYTKKRVYSSHISSITRPDYPAISLHLIDSIASFQNPDYVSMSIQIDCWMKEKDYEFMDILAVINRIRICLHRQNLTDIILTLISAQCVERSAGPLIHEDDTGLLHYPMRYQVVAA